MKKVKEGIILYDIEMHGCLNGVYTNEHVDGEIFNEISRKATSDKFNEPKDIIGTYDCFYFDEGNSRENATLEITLMAQHTNTYEFLWIRNSDNIPVFKGVGYKIKERQLAVHYWAL